MKSPKILATAFLLSGCSPRIDFNLTPRPLKPVEQVEVGIVTEAMAISLDDTKGRIGTKVMAQIANDTHSFHVKGARPTNPDEYVPVSAYASEKTASVVLFTLDSNQDYQRSYAPYCGYENLTNLDDAIRRDLFIASHLGVDDASYSFCLTSIASKASLISHEIGHLVTDVDHSDKHYEMLAAIKEAEDNNEPKKADRLLEKLARYDGNNIDWVQKIGIRTGNAVLRGLAERREEIRQEVLASEADCEAIKNTAMNLYGEIGDYYDYVQQTVEDQCPFYASSLGIESRDCRLFSFNLADDVRTALMGYYSERFEHNANACPVNNVAANWQEVRHTFPNDLIERFDLEYASVAVQSIPDLTDCVGDVPLDEPESWIVESLVLCGGC